MLTLLLFITVAWFAVHWLREDRLLAAVAASIVAFVIAGNLAWSVVSGMFGASAGDTFASVAVFLIAIGVIVIAAFGFLAHRSNR